ncbi:flagellar biosynthesis anti-sigma factor FlgM [Alloalcanivorax sp. C16-1]|uniref:flagellar biosynthesis anti-sigma factor FlgM n=1 Tax=Alloalcanivorax sp. C16-1 TaxID=3390051 RepID=UPI003970B46F
MKIDNISPLTSPGSVTPGKAGDKVDAAGTRAAPGAGEIAHLRPPTGDGQDIDTARVEELRQAIADGTLEIRADRIADGLIASVRDLLDADGGGQ